MLRPNLTALIAGAALALSTGLQAVAQPALASWNDGAAKRAVIAFVTRVISPGADFVAPESRVAVFDNDGTLWTESPIPTELAFTFARAGELAKADPSLAQKPAYAAVLSGDPKRIAALSEPDLLGLFAATHAGMTTDEFQDQARAFLTAAKHPRFGRPYTQLVYQPMLELLDYLRANGFQTYIVSGGDTDFMRTFAEQAYRIPPQNVIGSSSLTTFEQKDGRWGLVRTSKLDFDDGPTKPVHIAAKIGRRPIFAAGNSDGDLQMIQYATSGDGPRMGLIVHHDDSGREYAYDRQSKLAKLDKALDLAGPGGWTVVSMKSDWTTVFPAANDNRPK